MFRHGEPPPRLTRSQRRRRRPRTIGKTSLAHSASQSHWRSAFGTRCSSNYSASHLSAAGHRPPAVSPVAGQSGRSTRCKAFEENEPGVYGNRTHCELCSNPPLVLKTRAPTRGANTPERRAFLRKSQRPQGFLILPRPAPAVYVLRQCRAGQHDRRRQRVGIEAMFEGPRRRATRMLHGLTWINAHDISSHPCKSVRNPCSAAPWPILTEIPAPAA